MATDIFPLEVWTSQITQASVPANENSLRVQVVESAAIDIESTQPGSPTEDDLYVLGSSPAGAQWSSFAEGDVVIFKGGTWLSFSPFEGWLKVIAGDIYTYTSGSWTLFVAPPSPATPPEVVSVTASETLAIGRANQFLECDHASVAIVITVPAESSVAFDIGTEIHLRWTGVAAVSVAPDTGVTITYPASQSLALAEQYAVATLKKVGSDSWALFGLLEAA